MLLMIMPTLSSLRSVSDMVLVLVLLLAGAGVGPGRGQLAAKPTRGPHPSSPCPSVFSYEGREPENNRWHGVVLVTTDETLDGLILNIRLTNRAQILGNYIGDVVTSDNTEFTILSLKQRVTPGPPLPVRIFTAFGDRDDIPYVANIKLNGRTICGTVRTDSASGSSTSLLTPTRITKPSVSRPAGIGGAGGGIGGAPGSAGGAGGAVSNPGGPTGGTGGAVGGIAGAIGGAGSAFLNSGSTSSVGSAGGATSGISSNSAYAAARPFEEAVPPPQPPALAPVLPPAVVVTEPPPRPTLAPVTSRPTPVYDPPPSANPDNYYPSNSVNSNESPTYNRYESVTKRPSRPAADEADAYRPQQSAVNNSAAPEPERGIYRPPGAPEPDRGVYRPPSKQRPARPQASPAAQVADEPDVYRPNYTTTTEQSDRNGPPRPHAPAAVATTERYERLPAPTKNAVPAVPAATERPGPVYPQKYGGSDADDYRTTRVAPPATRKPPSTRPEHRPPASSLPPVERRPAVAPDADLAPQPHFAGRPERPERPSLDAAPDGPPPRVSRPPRSTCGTIAPPATPLIINGETSIPGKWPWHVALYKPHGRDWKYQCGGSLVSPTVVVTAAHCVTTSVGRPVGPESLLVFLGKHALRTTTEDGVQDKHVYFIHVHPGYNYTNYRNDIAVLVLSSPAAITSAVRPVCLWDKEKADLSTVEGKFGTVVGWRTDLAQPETDSDKVVGWGIETDGLLTEELHQALMPVVSPAICVYSYPSFFGVYTNNRTYCAGYSPDQPAAGTSVCNGDSGGGMFFKQDENVPDDEAVWMLRGLVSLSVRTKQDRCDPSHFVVFTDVAQYVDWLENFLVP